MIDVNHGLADDSVPRRTSLRWCSYQLAKVLGIICRHDKPDGARRSSSIEQADVRYDKFDRAIVAKHAGERSDKPDAPAS
jgi:hypothetical protein